MGNKLKNHQKSPFSPRQNTIPSIYKKKHYTTSINNVQTDLHLFKQPARFQKCQSRPGQSAEPTIGNIQDNFSSNNESPFDKIKSRLNIQEIIPEINNNQNLTIRDESDSNIQMIEKVDKMVKFNPDELLEENYSNKTIIQKKKRVVLQYGIIYEGQFYDKMRHGKGKQIWPDGSIYEGYWEKDVPHGQGILKYSNFDHFQGNWVNGRVEGYGVYRSGCCQYAGNWKNSLKHGRGIQKYADHSIYQGEFIRGMRHGQGILKLSNGCFYEGKFKNNQFHGLGTCTWPGVKKYFGNWKHGKFNGKGILTWQNGDKYEGEYLNDQKHGAGIFWHWNGQVQEGVWYKGKYKEDKQYPTITIMTVSEESSNYST